MWVRLCVCDTQSGCQTQRDGSQAEGLKLSVKNKTYCVEWLKVFYFCLSLISSPLCCYIRNDNTHVHVHLSFCLRYKSLILKVFLLCSVQKSTVSLTVQVWDLSFFTLYANDNEVWRVSQPLWADWLPLEIKVFNDLTQDWTTEKIQGTFYVFF